MSTFVIQPTEDTNDCESCGTSYAQGFNVTKDAVPFGDFEPSAHCFDSCCFELEDVLREIIKDSGHEIEMIDMCGEPIEEE